MKRFLSLLLFAGLLGASCFVQDARAGIFCDLLTTQSGVAYYPVQHGAVYQTSSGSPQNSIISDIRSIIDIINLVKGTIGGTGGGGGGGGGSTSDLKGTLDRIDQKMTNLEDLIKNRLARNEQDLKDEVQARQDSINALESKMLEVLEARKKELEVQTQALGTQKTSVADSLAQKADQTKLDAVKAELKAEMEKMIRSTVLASQKQMLDDLTPNETNPTATTRLQNGPLKDVKANFDANKYDERWKDLKKIVNEISAKP